MRAYNKYALIGILIFPIRSNVCPIDASDRIHELAMRKVLKRRKKKSSIASSPKLHPPA